MPPTRGAGSARVRRPPVDETRLLRAIRALDDVSSHRRSADIMSPAAWAAVEDDARRTFHAWGSFLDITVALDSATCEDSRREIALVLEARVLSCVARFVAGKPRRHGAIAVERDDDDGGRPAWRQWSCSQPESAESCIAGVVRTTVCCILFELSRHAPTVMLVMRSGLFTFLLDECRAATASPSVSASDLQQDNPPSLGIYDARDVTLAVDPFDWSTRALWTALQREEDAANDVFSVPIGARSLSYLLQGHRLPTNEAEEYAILEPTLAATATCDPPAPVSPLRPTSPLKRHAKPRRLPSMFSFPTRVRDEDKPAPDCPVCAPRQDPMAWAATRSANTRLHFAARAVVALAVHVPATSPEGKTFVRDGGVDVLRALTASTESGVDPQSTADAADSRRVVCEMARAALQLLEKPPEPPATDPLTRGHQAPGVHKRTPAAATTRSPLGDKLRAVSESTRRETAKRQQHERVTQFATKRASARRRVREALDRAAETRAHLLASLAVLSCERAHPAGATQRVEDWLASFVTVEKAAQQRREQEEARQRRLLEAQFQADARRRRERDERNEMARHDHDTRDEFAAERAAAQREAFARLQREMYALQDAANADAEEEQEKKRARARQEALRLQRQADERRRQALEADRMAREDHYFAEKLLREKRLREERERQAQRADPIAEQRRQIEAMRRRDEDTRQRTRELEEMRSEDLHARQRRFLEAEARAAQAQRERNERKAMETEERRSRQQWVAEVQLLAAQQREIERQQRAEARRSRRQQEHEARAWVACYDAVGNVYYYNKIAGASQWEPPATTATTTTGDAAATWPGTS